MGVGKRGEKKKIISIFLIKEKRGFKLVIINLFKLYLISGREWFFNRIENMVTIKNDHGAYIFSMSNHKLCGTAWVFIKWQLEKSVLTEYIFMRN